jgi:hypothetical protein
MASHVVRFLPVREQADLQSARGSAASSKARRQIYARAGNAGATVLSFIWAYTAMT